MRKIVDLATKVESLEDGGRHSLNVHLGIYREEIDLEDAVVEVGLKTAFVSVETEGMDLDPASKYADIVVPAKTAVEYNVTETLSMSVEDAMAAKAAIKGNLSPLKASLDASLNGEVSGKQTSSFLLAQTHAETKGYQAVEAIGDDRWKIAAEKGVLHGKFLNGPLCEAALAPGRPNRVGVTVSVNVRKRDVDVKLTADRRRLKFQSMNRERMIALLLARSLTNASPSGSESILLAMSESVHEE
ncbi:hypothetical protein [Rhizobium leguminosarum]|uniref:hypothetical protein n=1 Tax=Rhizobium leguminosarum TaxID=384 RepID=UPI001C95A394|nr:hypothetical protein [Rhizobium leguminosarum]MBY5645875.1 hypothetical protein [Rhizobium leguminosarum]